MLMGVANAQTPIKVDEVSKLVLDVDVDDGVHVKSVMTIQNLIDKPLVPGIGEIRLQKSSPQKFLIIPIPFTEKRDRVKVENLKAYTTDGKNINVRVEYKEDYTIIHYEVWYPIEPKGKTTIVFEYDSPDLIESGILFKTTTIPVGTNIDVKDVEVDFKSKSLNLVYLKEGAKSVPAGRMTFYTAEFSILPLPVLGFKWSIAFWIITTIVIVCVVVFVRAKKIGGGVEA